MGTTALWFWERFLRPKESSRPPTKAPPRPSHRSAPSQAPVVDVLSELEPHLRRLHEGRAEHEAIGGLLAALRTSFDIEPVIEEVGPYSDTLLGRYTLGEPVGPERAVRVWEPYWRRGDAVLFKGTLRQSESGVNDK